MEENHKKDNKDLKINEEELEEVTGGNILEDVEMIENIEALQSEDAPAPRRSHRRFLRRKTIV